MKPFLVHDLCSYHAILVTVEVHQTFPVTHLISENVITLLTSFWFLSCLSTKVCMRVKLACTNPLCLINTFISCSAIMKARNISTGYQVNQILLLLYCMSDCWLKLGTSAVEPQGSEWVSTSILVCRQLVTLMDCFNVTKVVAECCYSCSSMLICLTLG